MSDAHGGMVPGDEAVPCADGLAGTRNAEHASSYAGELRLQCNDAVDVGSAVRGVGHDIPSDRHGRVLTFRSRACGVWGLRGREGRDRPSADSFCEPCRGNPPGTGR